MSDIITPEFLFDFESGMQVRQDQNYAALTNKMWWNKIATTIPSGSKKERVAWMLSTAMIKDQGKGGNINFDDLVAKSTEYENGNSGTALKLKRDQLSDADGKGLEYAGQWSADIGQQMRYWPQKTIVKALLNGETGVAYDGKAFFATDHPYNPFDLSKGTYANVFTGAASGAYPGALRIDDSVTVDQAIINLSKMFAYIGSLKQANGEDPRMLEPSFLIVPPRLAPRAQQLTGAKFIAQAATSGGGSGDVESLISNWGLAKPVQAAEIGANFSYQLPDGTTVTGSDNEFYIAVDQLASSQLGALAYIEREAFSVTYYNGMTQAELDRMREFEWHCQGRNTSGYGHPYLLFKGKIT